jgi:predicted house-cleaning NTP pyrophosphatase (Maf/HAM1 superfamily)
VPRSSRLILASASPRRRELLGQLGIPFDVVVADVTEHEDPDTDPRAMVAHNAALKADWVAARISGFGCPGRGYDRFPRRDGDQQAARP